MIDWEQISLGVAASHFQNVGVGRLYAKVLAPNDNSKNQIYLGGSLEAAQLLPFARPEPEITNSGSRTLKAKVDLNWLVGVNNIQRADDAQLILYPQYPEVRLGSVLKGANMAPSSLISSREPGRVLLLGVTGDRKIMAACVSSISLIASELRNTSTGDQLLLQIPLTASDSSESRRRRILQLLAKVYVAGWLPSESLRSDGTRTPCTSGNCVGYTLEAALGIPKNGNSGPDLLGWEIKGAEVKNPLCPPPSKVFTLMTPEPSGGLYSEEGPAEFIRKFGYADLGGRLDRINFGGIHKVGVPNPRTGLTLLVEGGSKDGKFDPFGKLALVDPAGYEAASWSFAKLAELWNRKHSYAAYMFAQKSNISERKYNYGALSNIAEGTRLDLLISALSSGKIYFDPGMKLENVSGTVPKVKRRSQFRIKYKDLKFLYKEYETVSLEDWA